jgi:multicomponent K+:H+ antiporter subunit D
MLLLVVFAVKAALLPLGFWLPDTYGAAPAPVAALFALMTKVGVYAIVRVSSVMFGAEGGPVAGLGAEALFVLGVATIAVGALGTLAAPRLTGVVSFVVSAGTLLAAAATGRVGALGGALYYLVHSTVVVALLFLLADVIGRQRGALGDGLRSGAPLARPTVPGLLFLAAAAAVAGLPPLGGFVGKLLLLSGTAGAPGAAWLWAAVLGSGLVVTIALARAGSRLFWKTRGAAAATGTIPANERLALTLFAGAALALAVFAGPVQRYAAATAAQLHAPRGYVERILGAPAVVRAAHAAPVPVAAGSKAEAAR